MTARTWVLVSRCEKDVIFDVINLRPWPEPLADIVNRYRESATSGMLVIPDDDTATIDRVNTIFEQTYGFKPFHRIVPRYTPGKEDEYPYYVFGVKGRDIDLKVEVNYENQMDCGNPPPDLLAFGGLGCANGKRQIKDLSLAKPLKRPAPDFFLIRGGPRFPFQRVYGVSQRAHDIMKAAGVTGCELRPIRNPDETTESGLYQLTITGDTAEPYELRAEPPKSSLCLLCKYDNSPRVDMGFGRPDRRAYFSNLDFQVTDLASWQGRVFRVVFNKRIIISGRLAKLIRENKLTGWLRASKKYAFEPVLLEDFYEAVVRAGTGGS